MLIFKKKGGVSMNYIDYDSVPMDCTFLERRLYDEGRDVNYFNWLCDLINLDEAKFDILIYELHSIEYEWSHPFDADRSYDGFVLRYSYDGYSDLNVEDPTNKHCTVLEALIALSKKMDYILDDEDKGDRTRLWFWEMIDNLGLSLYSNDYFQDPFGRDLDKLNEIHQICDDWMNRRFQYDGTGSPFPLNIPYEDQREIDIIKQMNEYIMEKHMYKNELL